MRGLAVPAGWAPDGRGRAASAIPFSVTFITEPITPAFAPAAVPSVAAFA
jgi:hypothetical protein